MDKNGVFTLSLAVGGCLLLAFGFLLYLAYMRYNRKAVLEEAAMDAIEGACMSIARINYRTGRCVFMKDDHRVTDALYQECDWMEYRRKFLKVIHPKDREVCRTFTSPENMRRIREKGAGGATCLYRKQYEEDYRWTQSVMVSMRGKKYGNCVLMFDRDVEESARAEECHKEQLWEMLLKAKRSNAAKADFLKFMSGELRVPAATVRDMGALVRESVEEDRPEDACYYARRIKGLGAYMSVLLEDAARMGIPGGGIPIRREAFSMREFLEDCREYALAWGGGDIGFSLDTDSRLREQYMGDSARLAQVVYSLLSNACRFSYEGSDVRLLAKLEESGEGADRISFAVKDTGCGIGEDFLPEIFEPFTREGLLPENGGDGAGLGLSLAKAVADALEGSIRVESRQGEGSCFTVDLWLEHVPA